MDFRDRLIADLARTECRRLCRRVIQALQRITDARLSGDDSELSNAWDEICVQVQFQHSAHWDAYEDTIRATIRYSIESLPTHVAQAIWSQTENGFDWAWERKDEHQPPYIDELRNDDIEDYVLSNYVLAEADEWSNPRIRAFLDRHYSGG